MAGIYIDSLGSYHGFLRAANGTITVINVAGAATTAGKGTTVTAIDAEGNIAGFFTSASGNYYETQGFLRATDGTITTFNGPDGAGIGSVLGINAAGDVTGTTDGIAAPISLFALQMARAPISPLRRRSAQRRVSAWPSTLREKSLADTWTTMAYPMAL